MPKVSVIIPVYNVEKYLRQCMDSVVNQTLKDIEIICVNDCSPDNSAEILREYAAQDPRVVVLNMEKNSGQSAARNKALDIANGKYVQFLDADDWLNTDCCRQLFEQAESKKLDMLSMAAVSYIEDTHNYIDEPFYNFYYLKKIENCSTDIYKRKWWLMAPSASLTVYKYDFLSKNNIRFKEGVKFEDCLFFKIALFAADSVGVNFNKLYYRRKHSESTVNNGGLHYLDWLDINEAIYQLALQNNIPDDEIKKWLNSTLGYTYMLYKNIKKEFRRLYYKKARNFYLVHQLLIDWNHSAKIVRNFFFSILYAPTYITFRLLYAIPKKVKVKRGVYFRIFGIKFLLKGSCNAHN